MLKKIALLTLLIATSNTIPSVPIIGPIMQWSTSAGLKTVPFIVGSCVGMGCAVPYVRNHGLIFDPVMIFYGLVVGAATLKCYSLAGNSPMAALALLLPAAAAAAFVIKFCPGTMDKNAKTGAVNGLVCTVCALLAAGITMGLAKIVST